MMTAQQFERLPELFKEIINVDRKISALVSQNPFPMAMVAAVSALRERRQELHRAAANQYGARPSGSGGPALA